MSDSENIEKNYVLAASSGEQPNTQKENETVEIGVTGLKTSGGYVIEDIQPKLRGISGRRKFREMADNDPTIGALLTAIEMIIRAVEFRWEAAEADIDNRYVEFAEAQFEDMDMTWDDTISEILSMLIYGFAFMEMVFKRREDGLLTTAKFAPRAQESILEFDIDEYGELRGINQCPETSPGNIYIPATRLLHFKTKNVRGNPEGFSVLRRAYKPYHFLKNIEMYEAIAIERELNGLPIIEVPSAIFSDQAKLAQYKRIARDIKINEQGGIVIPSDLYKDSDGKPTNQRLYNIRLLASEGSRNIDTNQVVIRHQQSMVRSVLADFLLLGTGDKGSFALSKSKTDLFLKSLEAILANICGTLNTKWVKSTLWPLNGFPEEMAPKLVHGNVAPVDLQEIGQFVRDTGLMATSDYEFENFLRESMGAPKIGESGEDIE